MQCTLPLDGLAEPRSIGGGAPGAGQAAETAGGGKRRKAKAAASKSSEAGAKSAKAAAFVEVMAGASEVRAQGSGVVASVQATLAVVEETVVVESSLPASMQSSLPAAGQAAGPAAGPAAAQAEQVSVSLYVAETQVQVEAARTAPVAVAEAAALPELRGALAIDQLRVVVFDVETTGTDRRNDQVIELGVQLGLGSAAEHKTWRFRPDVPIHPGAQAVHGISMADLEGCPAFRDCVDEIAALFEQVDVIIGYNIAFDIDMLQAEYERAGKRPLDFSGKTIVDAFRLWQQCEPRSLQHAHQRFVGDRFSAAHSASADVAATGRVLTGMLRAFGLEQQDWGAIAGLCDPQRATWIGPSRHLRWESGTVVLGFGKHQGSPLHKIAHGPDRSFLRWVLDKDFPTHVMEICRAALELAARVPSDACDQVAEAVAAWVRERFGPPPALPAAGPPGVPG